MAGIETNQIYLNKMFRERLNFLLEETIKKILLAQYLKNELSKEKDYGESFMNFIRMKL